MTQKKKLCFVIGPIGDEESAERIHADWFLEEIVEPVIETRPDFEVERADKLAQPGLIDAQVINKLIGAELVIADLTGVNPNAFYEIGIRHMAQKPIIHMHQVGERIPFDISLYRSIKFSRVRPADLRNAREDLSRAVAAVLASDYVVENPVTNARGRINLEQHATPEQRILFDQLRAMEIRLSKIESSPPDRQQIAKPVERADPSVVNNDHVSLFAVGDKVFHTKFGEGIIAEVDGAKLTIEFSEGRRRVIDSFVKPT